MLWLCRCASPLHVFEKKRKDQKHSQLKRLSNTNLQAYTRYLILIQCIILNYIRQRTTLHILHHHPKPKFIALNQIRFQKVDNIRVLGFLHHQDLVDNKFLSWLMRQIHLFDRNFLARGKRFGDVNVSGSTKEQTRLTHCGRKKENRTPKRVRTQR